MGERFHIDWRRLERTDHVVQFYDEGAQLVDAMHAFVADGLRSRESVVVIATEPHRVALRERLTADGVDVDAAIRQERYFPLSAKDTLELFMRGGYPEETSFRAVIGDVIGRARAGGRDLRAFGEMVALLWSRGNRAGAVRLEQLWNDLVATERFPLFCAYPRQSFGREFSSAVHSVCAAHTRVFGV